MAKTAVVSQVTLVIPAAVIMAVLVTATANSLVMARTVERMGRVDRVLLLVECPIREAVVAWT